MQSNKKEVLPASNVLLVGTKGAGTNSCSGRKNGCKLQFPGRPLTIENLHLFNNNADTPKVPAVSSSTGMDPNAGPWLVQQPQQPQVQQQQQQQHVPVIYGGQQQTQQTQQQNNNNIRGSRSPYTQKALAEIKMFLQPYQKTGDASSAASTISNYTSISGLSTGSSSGYCSASSGTGVPPTIIGGGCGSYSASGQSQQVDAEALRRHDLQGFVNAGCDREWLIRELQSKGFDGVNDMINYLYQQQQHQMTNSQGLTANGHSKPGMSALQASKLIRNPSFEREQQMGHHPHHHQNRCSPALDVCSTRSDSPGGSSANGGGGLMPPSKCLARQYSDQAPPPPPPPPRGVAPPTPPRGTTPPPPLPPPPGQGQTLTNGYSGVPSNVQQMLRRMSPVPPPPVPQQGGGIPPRGGSPVFGGSSSLSGRPQPLVVQNTPLAQQQLTQQLQAFNLGPPPPPPPPPHQQYKSGPQGQVPAPEPPPPYPISSKQPQAAPGQSPTALHIWRAKTQQPVIMPSVRSTLVQKPVLQTAIAPTAPLNQPNGMNGVSSQQQPPPLPSHPPPPPPLPPHPPPSTSPASVVSSVSATDPYFSLSSPRSSCCCSTASLASSSTATTATTCDRLTVPTTDPPSYQSTIQAMASGGYAVAASSSASSSCQVGNQNQQSSTPVISTISSVLENSSTPLAQIPVNQLATTTMDSPPPPTPPDPSMVVGAGGAGSAHLGSYYHFSRLGAPGNHHPLVQRKASPLILDTGSSRSASPVSNSDYGAIPPSSVSSSSSFRPSTPPPPLPPPLNKRAPPPPPPSSSPPPPLPPQDKKPPLVTPVSNGASSSSGQQQGAGGKTTHQSPIPERKKYSKEKEDQRRETKVKNYSPQAFKFYMEQHMENVLKQSQLRKHRKLQLEREMTKAKLSEEARDQMRKMLSQKESNYIRLKRAKMDRSQFMKIKTLGVGAFGEVALVKKMDVDHLYAMKTLRKTDVLRRNQVAHVKAERDILAEADNEWVVRLYYSFQDKDSLYFVMDYIPGGDLMSLLIRFGIFEEHLARFYIGELVCAIESVHKMGFIHRDIKPDNVLIDRDGHIKLTDFGLCTGFRWTHNSKYYQHNGDHSRQDSMDPGEDWVNECHCKNSQNASSGTNGCLPNCAGGTPVPVPLKPLERRRLRRQHQRCLAHSLVGTPNYIAPEVLLRVGYTQLCDWWSVGVILYEMLVGQPPFLANTPAETQFKVINWERTLRVPSFAKMSPEARDLTLKLCTAADVRLGKNGAGEVKDHPFFSPLDLDRIRQTEAPYKPTIRYDTDTSNFDPVDPDKLRPSGGSDDSIEDSIIGPGSGRRSHQPGHAFLEFTFRRFFDDGGHPYPLKSIAEAVAAAAASSGGDSGVSGMSAVSGADDAASSSSSTSSSTASSAGGNEPQTGSPVYV